MTIDADASGPCARIGRGPPSIDRTAVTAISLVIIGLLLGKRRVIRDARTGKGVWSSGEVLKMIPIASALPRSEESSPIAVLQYPTTWLTVLRRHLRQLRLRMTRPNSTR